jgi:hypothetical protein
MSWFKIENNVIDFRSKNKFINSIDAAELTIKGIVKNYPPPYRLMVSGGVDSQAMLWAWKQFGKDYIPTSVVYSNNYNEHDLVTLKEFALRENISIEYIEFDPISFYQNKFEDIANRFRCTSPQFATHLGFIENLNGTKIFSGDRLLYGRAIVHHNNLCVYRAAQEWDIVPYFFIHTPELAYSLWYDKKSRLSGQTREEMYIEKVNDWQDSGFPVIPQLEKYTGFEKIKEYYQQNFRHVLTPLVRLKYTHYTTMEPVIYDVLFRHPYEKKFGTPSFKHILNVIGGNADDYIAIEHV